ncbi:MAG: cellobiose phosphorylase, partial [Anaerolineae bacterium]
TERPNLMRTVSGEVYRTTVMAKLVGLALLKFATLDPLGMGIEMEAGKPGWYDALNGLPGLFGSSLCETYELERLLAFLLEGAVDKSERTLELPQEQYLLLGEVEHALIAWNASSTADRDHLYWDAVATARETYRAAVRFGFSGQTAALTFDRLSLLLNGFRAKVRSGIARAVEMNDGLPPTYLAYTVTDYELVTDAAGAPQQDERGRSHVRVKGFEPRLLPLFLEGPVHALRVESDLGRARQLYTHIRASELFDQKLGMYKVNGPLQGQSHEIGRARAFTPGWLENESIWLHMEYKYLLEVLRAGLYGEFFQDLEQMLIPFQDPAVYGRSPLENSSFLASSAHPDVSLHGNGFVARLSGATAEFLSIWNLMMAGERPFFVQDGELCLAFRPVLPAWLFDQAGTVAFMFLGHTRVIYHNPERHDISQDSGAVIRRCVLYLQDERRIEVSGSLIAAPYAELVRAGKVNQIKVYL